MLLAREQVLADETGIERVEALDRARTTLQVVHDGSSAYAAHRRALDTITAYAGRTGSGYVVDAFWSAWDAFAGSASSYRETIERAVRTGHDTDTTAAIAGGLAGAWFGLDGIPPAWLGGMRGQSIVGWVAARWRVGDVLIGRSPCRRLQWRLPAAPPPRARCLGTGQSEPSGAGTTFRLSSFAIG